MAISSSTRKAGPYIGNDATTVFPFAFKVFAAADLRVVNFVVATGIETDLVLDVGYTVTLNADQDNDPGGSVTRATPLPTGQRLTITSNVPALQTMVLTNNGGFYPTVINDAFDKITIVVQQVIEAVSRSLRLPISSTANATLPGPVANNLIGWNAAADGFANYDTNSLTTIATYADAFVNLYNGDGTTTVFTMTGNPGLLANMDVSISGITQIGGEDYSFSGTTLTFFTAPPAGTRIRVRYTQAVLASDATAALGAAAAAAASAVLADADRVQTGLDRVQTGLDRTQTGIDAAAAAAAVSGLGTMSSQNASSVAITGGTISGVTLSFPSGTVSAPGLPFSGDLDTGLYRPAVNTIAATAGGVEGWRVTDVLVTVQGVTVGRGVGNDVSNAVLGTGAFAASTGSVQNVAVGQEAMKVTTSGGANTAIGFYSMRANTTGARNVAVGNQSLLANISGNENTAVGHFTLQLSTSASSNSAFGHRALQDVTSGDNNTGLGFQAGLDISTGARNTAVGYQSMLLTAGGSNNTAVGASAMAANTSGSNNIVIGSVPFPGTVECDSATGSNQINIGNVYRHNRLVHAPATLATLNAFVGLATGTRAICSDSTTVTFNATVTGGGANTVPVWYNGTNWIVG